MNKFFYLSLIIFHGSQIPYLRMVFLNGVQQWLNIAFSLG